MPEKIVRIGAADVDVGPLLSDPETRRAFGQVLFEIHDPMYAIMVFSELLIAELAPIVSSQHLQHLRCIHSSANLLLQIRNKLLDAGREAHEAGRQQRNIAAANAGRSPTAIKPVRSDPVAPPVTSVRSEPPKPTYFSEKAKPIAAGLVRRMREPLDVLIKTAEALQSLPPPPNEHYRRYVTDIWHSAHLLAHRLVGVLYCNWDGEVPHHIVGWAPVDPANPRTSLNVVLGFSEVMSQGLNGPLDETLQRYCKEMHAAAVEVLDKFGRLIDLAKVDMGKFCDRDGEIVTLEDALKRGWF